MTDKLRDAAVISENVADSEAIVAVVGCGVMGVGIAQLAAIAGQRVLLYDIRPGALAVAIDTLKIGVERLVDKSRIAADGGRQALARIGVAQSLGDLRVATIVIEAVGEDFKVKAIFFKNPRLFFRKTVFLRVIPPLYR